MEFINFLCFVIIINIKIIEILISDSVWSI